MSNNTTSLPAENSSHPRKGTPIRKKQREEAQQFINTLQGVTFSQLPTYLSTRLSARYSSADA